MIHFCVAPFAIPTAPTHFDKNPLNVNLVQQHTLTAISDREGKMQLLLWFQSGILIYASGFIRVAQIDSMTNVTK